MKNWKRHFFRFGKKGLVYFNASSDEQQPSGFNSMRRRAGKGRGARSKGADGPGAGNRSKGLNGPGNKPERVEIEMLSLVFGLKRSIDTRRQLAYRT